MNGICFGKKHGPPKSCYRQQCHLQTEQSPRYSREIHFSCLFSITSSAPMTTYAKIVLHTLHLEFKDELKLSFKFLPLHKGFQSSSRNLGSQRGRRACNTGDQNQLLRLLIRFSLHEVIKSLTDIYLRVDEIFKGTRMLSHVTCQSCDAVLSAYDYQLFTVHQKAFQ